jgi:hypothetical protein
MRTTDFNGQNSIISLFKSGMFGPLTTKNTRLNNITIENNKISGHRLTELQYIYNDTLRL